MGSHDISVVPQDDRPDATVENVPDDVVAEVVLIATYYGACPSCGEEQFVPYFEGYTNTYDCRYCGFEIHMV